MKDGAWIVAADGRYQWVTEHASWLQDPAHAKDLGLGIEAIRVIQGIPWDFNGPGRVAICREGMEHGLIRFRGHGSVVTFEAVLPIELVLQSVGGFIEMICGPYTSVTINRLDNGESLNLLYSEIRRGVHGSLRST